MRFRKLRHLPQKRKTFSLLYFFFFFAFLLPFCLKCSLELTINVLRLNRYILVVEIINLVIFYWDISMLVVVEVSLDISFDICIYDGNYYFSLEVWFIRIVVKGGTLRCWGFRINNLSWVIEKTQKVTFLFFCEKVAQSKLTHSPTIFLHPLELADSFFSFVQSLIFASANWYILNQFLA